MDYFPLIVSGKYGLQGLFFIFSLIKCSAAFNDT